MTQAAVEYFQAANEQTAVLALIEEEEGFRNLDEIGRVDGLDLLFFGAPHIYSWAKEPIHVAEKAAYLDPTFFRVRGVIVFGLR